MSDSGEKLPWWKRARSLWWQKNRPGAEPRPAPLGSDEDPPRAEPSSMSPEEAYLRHLLDQPPEKRSAAELADGPFWSALDKLQSSRPRLARTLLQRFVVIAPQDDALVLRLAELDAAEEPEQAMILLRRLLARRPLEHPSARRAHALAGELAERAGSDEADQHFSALLAVDIDHPLVRARRPRLAQKPAASGAGATVAGLPDGGALAGRYRLVRELGRGGAGTVYEAIDVELERHVALKVLHPQLRVGRRAERQAQAWLEARTAAAHRHPGVVTIFDLDEERQLLAMELCAAGSLARVVAAGPSDFALTLARAVDLLTTLVYLHARGLTHGDLKPANLLLRAPDDRAMVIGDFGLARLTEGDAGAQLSAGGTLGYLAPEARRGVRGPASDLYSVGVIVAELLLGRAALADRFTRAVADAEADARLVAQLPPPLQPLLTQLLAADPAARPTTAEARARMVVLASAP